jgi:hypothetical protein
LPQARALSSLDQAARRWSVPAAGLLAALLVFPCSAEAQLTNDVVPQGRTIPLKEEVETEMQNARFKLGPVRLLPQLILNGPTYDSNALGATGGDPKFDDWTASVSAGLGVLIPLSKKMYLRGTILPEYIWYDRLEDRRTFGGTYGGSLYGFFNRLSFQADYATALTPTYANSEILTPVLGDFQGGSLKTEVEISGLWSVYAAGVYQELDYSSLGNPIVNLPLSFLDRNEGAVRGGLRYHWTSYFYVGVGGEGTRTEFPEDPLRADNDSTAFIASVHYDRPRLFINLNGGYRQGRAINGSRFPEYDTFTGSGFISYQLLSRMSLSVYGQRRVTYALFVDNPYYFENLGGVGLSYQLGARVNVNGFAELGTNEYPVPVILPDESSVVRVDDVTNYGGGFTIRLWKGASFGFQVTQMEFDSNVPQFDRDVLRFTGGLTIGVFTP